MLPKLVKRAIIPTTIIKKKFDIFSDVLQRSNNKCMSELNFLMNFCQYLRKVKKKKIRITLRAITNQ